MSEQEFSTAVTLEMSDIQAVMDRIHKKLVSCQQSRYVGEQISEPTIEELHGYAYCEGQINGLKDAYEEIKGLVERAIQPENERREP